jgi:hypothetical protein
VGVVAGQPPAKPAAAEKGQTFKDVVHGRIESALKVLADGGDFAKAQASLGETFDLVVARAPATDSALFADAAFAMRLVESLGETKEADARPLLTFLRQNDALARELVFQMGPEDKPVAVYGVLKKLVAAAGPSLGKYPALVAAICVVYDRPHYAVATRTKDSPGTPIEAAEVFAYFTAHEGKMLFGLNSLPPEALIYMVDTTAAVPELEWALTRHAGDRNVGKRYGDLVYDTAAFKFNKPKKIDSMPYTLENLARAGGVCQEQAYYATHVAKAIGVPAAAVYGQSSEVAHVWVAFLQQRGSLLVWNMDEGHYNEYEKLRGTVVDPQTGKRLSDDQMAVSSETYGRTAAERQGAAALIDAARRLAEVREAKDAWPPALEGPVQGALPAPRGADGAAQLSLLEAAVRGTPCSVRAWGAVEEAAGAMNSEQRAKWFDLLTAQCGRKYMGFAFGVAESMISAVVDPAEQSRGWDWAFNQYRQKPDLASEARIRQGELWEKAGEKEKAFNAYLDVSKTFPNDGVRAVEALMRAEKLLKASGKQDAAVDMYRDAWHRTTRGETTSAFAFSQSNFYRVGELYAKALDRAGRTTDAANVRRQLEAGVAKDKR